MTDREWDFQAVNGQSDPVAPPQRPAVAAAPSAATGWDVAPAGSPIVASASLPASPPQIPSSGGGRYDGRPPVAVAPPAYADPQPTGQLAVTAPPIQGAAPAAAPASSKGSGWGWKSLVAFIAGGAMTAAGFGLGMVSDDNATVVNSSGEVVSTSGSPITVTAPDLDTDEPAAFVSELLGPSVVQVEHSLGLGSGVVFADGLIMTNHHVIDGASSEIIIRTSDGRVYDTTLLGSDPRVDVAVLQVIDGEDLPVAELALDGLPEVGSLAIAIGSPFSLQQTVTSGIISAVNRPVQTSATVVNAMIQTDTAINPGNSGGVLADRLGRVTGINTSIQTDGTSTGNVGVGFAIPIDTAYSVATRIINGESLEAGFLGVGTGEEPANGEAGVIIGEITAGSGAADAGLQVGDRVVTFNDAPVASISELAGLVQSYFAGDVVDIQVVRGNETLTLQATLGER